jgi:Ca2+-binding RTX toxin-like protein
VQTSVTYSLSTNVENMTLTGSAAINGTGNDLANIILGNTGNNILIGGLSNDSLSGGSGNDTLYGGAGNDTLTGGAGNDVFVFDTLPNQTTNRDLITDFVSRGPGATANNAADYLLFSKSIFQYVNENPGSGSQVTIASTELRSGANIVTAQTTSQHFIYNTITGILYYDQDGSTATYSPIQIALLGAATHPALDYRDIHILG